VRRPVALPEADALRRSALEASWRRDRRVGRRRLAWRYITWAAGRAAVAGIPVLAIFLVWRLLMAPDPPPQAAGAPAGLQAPGLALRLDPSPWRASAPASANIRPQSEPGKTPP